jgi:hypothetical protein
MVLYEELSRKPRLWKLLQELTSEFWGSEVPEELVLKRLAEGGVPTPNFTRKRFLRDDEV